MISLPNNKLKSDNKINGLTNVHDLVNWISLSLHLYKLNIRLRQITHII